MGISTRWWATGWVCASVFAAASAHAATLVVPAGGDLQAAINAAQAGDVITLAAGATYVGNFTLPNKGAMSDYITIRSSADDSLLPPAGVRMTPAYAAQLPKIKSPNTVAALRTKTGTNHWKLMFLEFQANYKGYNDIVDLGAGDSTQTDLSQVPYALIVDRVYVHGDPVMGQKRGIALNSSDTQVVNSWISDCKAIGQDAQALSGWNGPGNYLIENNYLEGAAENFLLGGSDPLIPNLVPTNVTFRGNYLSKPVSWRDPIIATPANVAAVAAPGAGSLPAGSYAYKVAARVISYTGLKANSTPSAEASATVASGTTGGVTISWTPVVGATDYVVYGRTAGGENMYWITPNPYFTDTGSAGTSGTAPSATKWTIKNVFELKNAQDVLVEGNVIENVWVAGQSGYAVTLTPRNQNGTAPWSVVQRVTFQHNIVRHAAGAIDILGTDNINPSQMTNHLAIRDNVLYDISGAWGSGGKVFLVGDGGDSFTFDHNTIVTSDSTIVSLYGGTTTNPTPITNFVYTNSMSEHRTYGIFASGFSTGWPSINAYLPGSTISANVLAGGSASKYPSGNFFPTVTAWQSGFVDYAGGDYHLLAGSPYTNAGTDGADLGADIDLVNAYAATALTGDARVAPGTRQVQITTAGLPDAMLSTPYSQTVGCVGGSPACAWQLVSSALPDGLAFDPGGGVVGGTPTAVQTGNVTVTAYDPSWPSNSATATLAVTVDAPPFTITVPAAPTAQVGAPYVLTPSVSGALGTVTWSIVSGALPAGLNLDPLSGTIAGTPSAWGTTSAVVQAADSWSPTRTAAATVAITVAPAPIAVAATTLPGALYGQSYAAVLTASGGTGTVTWTLVGGALPAGLTLASNGAIAGTPAALGTFTFTVQATDANWPTDVADAAMTLVVNAPSFTATLPPAPNGQVGVAYQTAPGATQGAIGTVTWTGSVPSGLTLNTSTGAIAGMPAAYGSFNVTLQAHDSYDASRVATASTTIWIAPAPLAITTTTLADANVRTPYQAALSAIGGTGQTTWIVTSGSLPAGLTLSSTGVISGTPTRVGKATFTVQAADAGWAGNIAVQTLTLTVRAREIVLYGSDATHLAGTWSLVSDTTAAGGARIWNPDFGAPKLATPLANPANYFEVTFEAEGGVAYHVWLRGKADKNYWGNDSVYIQFDQSVDADGAPMYRIGTTTGDPAVNLEDCSGCGLSGWGWQDNGYGVNVFGPDIYFAQSGTQTLRIQVREDGFSIDQIVLSADKYRTTSPGALKNDTTIISG